MFFNFQAVVHSHELPRASLSGATVRRLVDKEHECHAFERLQSTLEKKGIKDTMVITSWSNKSEREFDFIIVSLPLKSIFQIEVKKCLTKSSIKKAKDQLKKGKKFINSIIPFPLEDNLKLVRSFFVGEQEKELEQEQEPCSSCLRFFLSHESSLDEWWDGINADQQAQPVQESHRETYLKVVKYLLFQMFLQDDCITKGGELQAIESEPSCIQLLTHFRKSE